MINMAKSGLAAVLATCVLMLILLARYAGKVEAQSNDGYELVHSSLNSHQVSQGGGYLLIASFDGSSAINMSSAEFTLGEQSPTDTRQQIHLPILTR